MANYIKYNGLALEITQVRQHLVEPVYDDSGYNVTYERHTLSVDAWMFPESGGDPAQERFINSYQDAARLLREPRRELIVALGESPGDDEKYYYVGVGENYQVDLEGGPKPRLLSFNRITNDLAASVSWQVQFALRGCGEPASDPVAPTILWKTHSSRFQLNADGQVLRTISGRARISETLQSASSAYTRSAQRIARAITPQIPKGYRRIEANAQISEDGLTIVYEFVDEQLQVAWADAVTDMRAEFTESRQFASPWMRITLSFEATAMREVDKRTVFLDICEPLLNHYLNTRGGFVREVEYRTEIFTRKIYATVSRDVLVEEGQIPFQDVPRPTGPFFTAPPDSTFTLTMTPGGGGAGQRGFDGITYEGKAGAMDRWNRLPLLSRTILLEICSRTYSGQDPNYPNEIDDDSNAPLTVVLPEESGGLETSSESVVISPIFDPSYVLQSGADVADHEVVRMVLANHFSVRANATAINVSTGGEPQPDDVAHTSHQYALPRLRIVLVGFTERLDERPEAKPVPDIKLDDQVLDAYADVIDVRTVGPIPTDGGAAAKFGVAWRYEILCVIPASFLEATAEGALTLTQLPQIDQASRSLVWSSTQAERSNPAIRGF